MPNDRFGEVTTQSWFGQIGNAFTGIILGLILFVASFALLFWNEGRAVKQAKILHEGRGVVQPIPTFDVNPANN